MTTAKTRVFATIFLVLAFLVSAFGYNIQPVNAQGGTVDEGYDCPSSQQYQPAVLGVGGKYYICTYVANVGYKWTAASGAAPIPQTTSTPYKSSTDPAPTSPSSSIATNSANQLVVSGNSASITYNGEVIEMTKSPNGMYYLPAETGTITFFNYEECVYVYDGGLSFHWTKTCAQKSKYFQDIGLQPVWSVDEVAEARFYSMLRFLTFGAIGSVQSGTLRGLNGYQWLKVGSAANTTANTVAVTLSRVSVPVTVVGFLLLAGDVYVATYPIQAVPAPIAPINHQIVGEWSLEDYIPKPGVVGKTISNKYSGYAYNIGSIPNLCTMWFKANMPKEDFSELLEFEQKYEKPGQPCNVFTIISEMMKLGVKAAKAGVGIQFIKEFYLQVFSDIVQQMGLPQSGDYIIKLLGW